MKCTNQLKQLALAQHNHHDIYNCLPAGWLQAQMGYTAEGDWTGGALEPFQWRQNLSFLMPTLPFIEQTALYDAFLEKLNPFGGPQTIAVYSTYIVAAGGTAGTILPGSQETDAGTLKLTSCKTTDDVTVRPYVASLTDLYCPSDGNAKKGNGYDCTPSSYRCCLGDMPGNFSFVSEKCPRGAFQCGNQGKRGFEAITDGTSNTILLGEGIVCRGDSITSGSNVCPPTTSVAYPTKGGAVGVALNEDSTTTSPLALCLAAPKNGNDNKHLFPCWPQSQRWYRMPGGAWHIGGSPMSFVTALPPNSPFCTPIAATNTDGGSTICPNDNYCVQTTSSTHPGGVNVAMVDGSVRFVADSVDCGTDLSTPFPTLFGTKPADGWASVSGQSKWGVWGAMGTANCGESKSL